MYALCVFVAFKEGMTHPYIQQLSGTDVKEDHDGFMPTKIEEYK